jgi:hypothetical protein
MKAEGTVGAPTCFLKNAFLEKGQDQKFFGPFFLVSLLFSEAGTTFKLMGNFVFWWSLKPRLCAGFAVFRNKFWSQILSLKTRRIFT